MKKQQIRLINKDENNLVYTHVTPQLLTRLYSPFVVISF